jgi:hypothetical protein
MLNPFPHLEDLSDVRDISLININWKILQGPKQTNLLRMAAA